MKYIAILKSRAIVTENDNARAILNDAKSYAAFCNENVYIFRRSNGAGAIVTPEGKVMPVKKAASNRKWYNVELCTSFDCNAFSAFLKSHGIKYEKSAIDSNAAHYSVYCDPAEARTINNFINQLFDPAEDMIAYYCT